MTTYVVRPSATFCAKAETYLVEEAAFDAAREWTEEHGSPCRINVEQELPGYPGTFSIRPLGYFYRLKGKTLWLARDGAEPTAPMILANDVRGYRGKEVSAR